MSAALSWDRQGNKRMSETRGEYHTGTAGSETVTGEQSERWVKGSLPLPSWATEPEWVMRYGRALPLVIYLLKHADWATGEVCGYSHTACAEHYQCAKTTIAQQFRLLRECGKLAVTAQRQYDMDLVIARGPGILASPAIRKPRKVRTPKTDTTETAGYQFFDNLDTSGYQESDTLSGSGYQKSARRLSKNCYPLQNLTITSSSLQNDANASCVANADAEPGTATPPSQEVETKPETKATPKAPTKPRTPNPLWEALVEVFGYSPQSRPEQSNWGKIVHDLKAAGATADDIRQRARHHALAVEVGAIHWTLTPNALVTHWGELSRVPPPLKTPLANGRARAAPSEPKPLPVRRDLARDAKPAPLE